MAYDKLKPRHQRFVDAFIETGKGSESYRRAGYKSAENNHSVAVRASRLLSNVDIHQDAIAQRQQQLIDASTLTLFEKKAVLTEVMYEMR